MKLKREQALKLRLQGRSYTEIQRTINVSKSTLSAWLGQVILPIGLKQQIEARTKKKSLAGLLKHNKSQTMRARSRMLEIRKRMKDEIRTLTDNNLLFIGVALYWA